MVRLTLAVLAFGLFVFVYAVPGDKAETDTNYSKVSFIDQLHRQRRSKHDDDRDSDYDGHKRHRTSKSHHSNKKSHHQNHDDDEEEDHYSTNLKGVTNSREDSESDERPRRRHSNSDKESDYRPSFRRSHSGTRNGQIMGNGNRGRDSRYYGNDRRYTGGSGGKKGLGYRSSSSEYDNYSHRSDRRRYNRPSSRSRDYYSNRKNNHYRRDDGSRRYGNDNRRRY